jgi:hypothetical protein
MRLIKLYEEFWGKSKSNNEDLEFDFLVAVGKMKQAINKTIEVHEKHYYNDDKIVKSEELQSELKSMIDSIIDNGRLMTEDFCELVEKFESSLYNDNKFGISSGNDYSIFGIFDDCISSLRACVREKNEKSVSYLDKESQHILDRCDDSWVYIDDEQSSKLDDFFDDEKFDKTLSEWEEDDENDEDNIFPRWVSPEVLQSDIEEYIGKKIGDFEYGDKLEAFNWVKENCDRFIEENSDLTEQEKESIESFLNSIKEFFGL